MSKLVESLLLILAFSIPLSAKAGDPVVENPHEHREVYYINGAGLLGTFTNEPCDFHPGIPPGIEAWQATTQDPVEGAIQGCWLWETNGFGIIVYWQDAGSHASAMTDFRIFKTEKPKVLPGEEPSAKSF